MKQHDLRETYSEQFNSFTLTLRGDGSKLPELKVRGARGGVKEAAGYVSSDALRSMAKQLKKWAKALEANGS